MPLEFILPIAALIAFVIWASWRTKRYLYDPTELGKALPRILHGAEPYHGPVTLAGRAERAKRLFL